MYKSNSGICLDCDSSCNECGDEGRCFDCKKEKGFILESLSGKCICKEGYILD
jgi:hypothetical protein